MNTITLNINDERFQKLQATASRLGISVEELVLVGIDNLLTEKGESFQNAMEYVLNKNAELYKRLA